MAKTASKSFSLSNHKATIFCCFDVFSIRRSRLFQVQAKISTIRPPVFPDYPSVSYDYDLTLEKNYSTYVLIHLANLITKSLDKMKFICELFVDLQKVIATFDRKGQLTKHDHYGIGGLWCCKQTV